MSILGELLIACAALWLALLPWMILREIRRHGEAREREALQAVGLLVSILQAIERQGCADASPSPAPQAQAAGDPLQAVADARAAAR